MRYVKYVGLSHSRVISATDWRHAGIQGDTIVWNAQNGFAVPLEKFTDDQIDKAIRPDANFVITGESEDFTPAPQTVDMVPAQVAQAAESPVDVVALLDGDTTASPTDSGAAGAPNGDAPTTKKK